MVVTRALNRVQNFEKAQIGWVTCTAGVVMTEVGNRALELTSRTRFFDLQSFLGVEEVYEKRQECEEEQENED